MSNKLLFALWGLLFIICAGLDFMPVHSGWMSLVSLLFFLPPAILLYRAGKQGDRAHTKLIALLSGASLVLTLVLLIGNVLSVAASEAVGTALYYLLVIVSAPMVCSGYWALSLFLWACLLSASLRQLRARK